MSSFQQFALFISASFVHHAANSGSVNFLVPTTAAFRSSIEVTDCDPRML